MAKEQRKPLDGNLQEDCRKQVEDILKNNIGMNPNLICLGSGVATMTLKRLRAGENISVDQYDKLGKWIVKNKL